MQPHLIEVQHIRDYVLGLRFSDGLAATIDLREELYGSVFEPLKNPEFFKQVAIHPVLHTLYWPNGADFAPEFLRSAVQTSA